MCLALHASRLSCGLLRELPEFHDVRNPVRGVVGGYSSNYDAQRALLRILFVPNA